MIALAVGPPLRVSEVAAPAYLSDHPLPMAAADLTAHRCVAYGDAYSGLSPSSFERDGHAVTVTPSRGPVFNDDDLMVAAALEGGVDAVALGLAVALRRAAPLRPSPAPAWRRRVDDRS